MALKIPPVCLLITIAASLALSPSSSEDHLHRVPPYSHGFAWPVWYRDRLLHARHARPSDVVPGTTSIATTTRSPWTAWPQIPATRSPQQVNPPSRHHVGQRTLQHKSSDGAVAVAKHDGTRTIAYASYHDNHRHRQGEAVTQIYQLVPTTAPTTYTRHHSGWVADKPCLSGIRYIVLNSKFLEICGLCEMNNMPLGWNAVSVAVKCQTASI